MKKNSDELKRNTSLNKRSMGLLVLITRRFARNSMSRMWFTSTSVFLSVTLIRYSVEEDGRGKNRKVQIDNETNPNHYTYLVVICLGG